MAGKACRMKGCADVESHRNPLTSAARVTPHPTRDAAHLLSQGEKHRKLGRNLSRNLP